MRPPHLGVRALRIGELDALELQGAALGGALRTPLPEGIYLQLVVREPEDASRGVSGGGGCSDFVLDLRQQRNKKK